MIRVAVTGADGFIGRNVMEAVGQDPELRGVPITRDTAPAELDRALRSADIVVHLAGSNRPDDPSEFMAVNRDFTAHVVDAILGSDARPTIRFASSARAGEDSEYGRSKVAGEVELERYREAGGSAVVYRLPNVFGKWARPFYNSAVATFCHQVARGEAIDVHDPKAPLTLVHVSDVVDALLRRPPDHGPEPERDEVGPVFETTVGTVAETIRGFGRIPSTLALPDLSEPLVRLLYSTFLTYVPPADLQWGLRERTDPRGRLAELLKGDTFGQIFVSTTAPGVIRGNHSHRAKFEKFFVLAGEGVIRVRDARSGTVREIHATGASWSCVDIPAGTIHNIENVGEDEMLVLFWASEPFDPSAPDTYPDQV